MCPDENTLLKFASGGAGELPALEAHLDACEDCRRAVAAAASERTLPTAPVTHTLAPGQRVARYEVERELGRGGMGIVYQARDVTLDRRVALKLLHARRDEAAQARLLREAQVMAKLTHPNVVPVFELGEWKSEVYLVMELVSGVTLEQWLKREKHRRSDIIHAFVQAGRGLAAAHAAGVVHRDFKPANVLVGADGRVRVTDFGLSRPGPALELPATDSAVVTRDGAIVGTLAYMSPEQIDGKLADERSDQFSFCVSLVEALTGLRPFEGENWAQLTQGLAKKPRLSGVPAALRGVLRKGLERDASRRYTSLTALLNAIERSQQLGWSAVALTATAAVVAAGVYFWPAPPAPQPQPGTVALAAEEYVPIVQAARDLDEGTIVTMDMIQQRNMPAMYVTSSIVKPDAASYIVGQKLLVPVQKGDALLWTHFETTKAQNTEAGEELVPVVVVARELSEGTVITMDMLEQRVMPAQFVTSSYVKPDSVSYIVGQPLNVPVQKGDALLWSQFETMPSNAELDAATKVVKQNMPALASCLQKPPAGTTSTGLVWSVKPDGSPYEVHLSQPELAGGAMEKCLAKAVSALHFPKKKLANVSVELVFEQRP